MAAGTGIACISIHSSKAIPALGQAASDNTISDKGAARTPAAYCSAKAIKVISVKRVEDEDERAAAIYNSEAVNDGVWGLFATLEGKSTPKSLTIDNCISNLAGVVRKFADNFN